MNLRDYQQELYDAIVAQWAAGYRNVLAVLPTGGGKTVTFAHIVHTEQGAVVVMAHRAELVSQIAVALAREGVRHRIIGPPALVKLCVAAQMSENGRSYYDPMAKVAVASVQSIASFKDTGGWCSQVSLVVHDEAHHLLIDNQFGKAVARFPNARVLGVTATPVRTDGKGLGRHADGLMDVMVQGPFPFELVEMGFLSKYRIFAPPSSFHREDVPVTGSGEFSPKVLRDATRKSTVTGDVVAHYVKHASGKLGLTFADSLENAATICANFRAAGVNAEVLSGKTDDGYRAMVLRKFRNREFMQIVSVALIDEGFDCPGVEVVSDAAATESFGRFAQRFGRGMRVAEGKEYMLYFDHVGNVVRHGLPDAAREWSLDRRERRAPTVNDAIPLRACTQCSGVYERFLKACPYCDHVPVPMDRSGPETVDGDLFELDASVLATLRKEVERIDGPAWPPANMAPIAIRGLQNAHFERQKAQGELRNTIALWGGWKTALGHDDSESYRLFYHRYGVDVLTAKTLGRREANELQVSVAAELSKNGVIAK